MWNGNKCWCFHATIRSLKAYPLFFFLNNRKNGSAARSYFGCSRNSNNLYAKDERNLGEWKKKKSLYLHLYFCILFTLFDFCHSRHARPSPLSEWPGMRRQNKRRPFSPFIFLLVFFLLFFSEAMLLLLLHFLDRRAQEAETSWSQEYERDIPEPRHHGCLSLLVRLSSSNELYLKSGDIPNQLVLSATTSFDLWTLEINRGPLSGVASLLLVLDAGALLLRAKSLHTAFLSVCIYPFLRLRWRRFFYLFIFLFRLDLNMQYGIIGVITGTFKFPFLAFFFSMLKCSWVRWVRDGKSRLLDRATNAQVSVDAGWLYFNSPKPRRS